LFGVLIGVSPLPAPELQAVDQTGERVQRARDVGLRARHPVSRIADIGMLFGHPLCRLHRGLQFPGRRGKTLPKRHRHRAVGNLYRDTPADRGRLGRLEGPRRLLPARRGTGGDRTRRPGDGMRDPEQASPPATGILSRIHPISINSKRGRGLLTRGTGDSGVSRDARGDTCGEAIR